MNCIPDPKCAYLAMKMVYEQFSGYKFDEPPPKQGKGKVKAIHYIQSFDPKDKISPELAHQISRTFARKAFGDNCQIVIATHVDKEHIHTHFIINTYGIDGQKFNDNLASRKNFARFQTGYALLLELNQSNRGRVYRVSTTANGNTS